VNYIEKNGNNDDDMIQIDNNDINNSQRKQHDMKRYESESISQ
jgi:hypothetical protein